MANVTEVVLSTMLQATQAMLAAADRDVKALVLIQAPPDSFHQHLLQPMLDRQLAQRFRLEAYQAQCADWHRARLTTQQENMLTTVESHLVYLKQCNQHLIQLLAFWQLDTLSEDALLNEWQLH